MLLITLEDLGFCAKGEGGAFVEDGRLELGGALPTNTDGGGLSACHPGQRGLFLLVEAVRQLRGEAGGRQVPDAKLACVSAHRRLVLLERHHDPRASDRGRSAARSPGQYATLGRSDRRRRLDEIGDHEAYVEVATGQRLTFAEWVDAAAGLADHLRTVGLQRGDVLAVWITAVDRLRDRMRGRGVWPERSSAASTSASGPARSPESGTAPAPPWRSSSWARPYVRGGYNVYPLEVENVLAEHPSIAAVAIIGAPKPVIGEIGVANIVVAPGAPPPTLEEVRAWVRERLADYKAPDELMFLDTLPLTAMGKVDKSALQR